MTPTLSGRLALLGAGKMGTALLSSWVSGGAPPDKIHLYDPSPCEKAQELIAQHNLALNGELYPAEILVIAVKPQIMAEVLANSQGLVNDATLVISIAAGQRLSAIENMLPAQTAIIRTMPNTPAEIGMGMTVACSNDHVSEEQRGQCDALFKSVGEVDWVEDEGLMDAVTAISGSGPAYIFHFTECLTEAGIASGLKPDLAAQLARATVSGAGALIHHTSLDASTLRENVTSPGGTTAAALEILMAKDGLSPLLKKAVEAAQKRAGELSS